MSMLYNERVSKARLSNLALFVEYQSKDGVQKKFRRAGDERAKSTFDSEFFLARVKQTQPPKLSAEYNIQAMKYLFEV